VGLARAGSSPAFGTTEKPKALLLWAFFVYALLLLNPSTIQSNKSEMILHQLHSIRL
jgi:hypothetical protein